GLVWWENGWLSSGSWRQRSWVAAARARNASWPPAKSKSEGRAFMWPAYRPPPERQVELVADRSSPSWPGVSRRYRSSCSEPAEGLSCGVLSPRRRTCTDRLGWLAGFEPATPRSTIW